MTRETVEAALRAELTRCCDLLRDSDRDYRYYAAGGIRTIVTLAARLGVRLPGCGPAPAFYKKGQKDELGLQLTGGRW